MKHVFFVPLAFALALGTSMAAEPPLEDLAGNYKVVALTRDGKEQPADTVNSTTVKIVKDELTITLKDKSHPAKIKVDPKAKPAAIDIAPTDGPEKGRTFLGIYKVENDELHIAFAESGDRPIAFKSDDGVLLMRLKKSDKK